jgi:hypothetical protein
MTTSARILRAEAQDIAPALFRRTPSQLARHESILAVGQALMARHGRQHILFTRFALALNLDPSTLRRDIIDLDAMLGEILRRHLRGLANALGKVFGGDPEFERKRRAAYLAYTRTPYGALVPAHLLLVRDRQFLPPDERIIIEQIRDGIGTALAGELGEEALSLLDTPGLDAARIEFIFAHYSPKEPTPTHPAPPRDNDYENPAPSFDDPAGSENIYIDAAYVAAHYGNLALTPVNHLDTPAIPRLNEAAATQCHETSPPTSPPRHRVPR